MIAALLLAAAAAVGGPALELAAGLVVWRHPGPSGLVLVGLAGWSLRSRRGRGRRSPEVAQLVALAAELRAGESLRLAVAALGEPGPGSQLATARRLALAGRPIEEVAEALEQAFGRYGRMVGAAVRLAHHTGGSAAPLFDRLALQAMEADDLARERRLAMAPALTQGVVVGGIPLAALAWMVVDGRYAELLSAGPVQAGMALAGAGFLLAGLGAVAVLVWRSGR